MRRLLGFLIVIPVALVLIVLAIANRAAVTVSLDPFAKETPAFAFTAPLFVFLLAALMVGVAIGGIATWVRQGRHRRLERQYRRDAERFKTEAERLKAATFPLGQIAAKR